MSFSTEIQNTQPFMLLPVEQVKQMQEQMAFLITECDRLRKENENLKKPMTKAETIDFLTISKSHYHTLKNDARDPLPVRQKGNKDWSGIDHTIPIGNGDRGRPL